MTPVTVLEVDLLVPDVSNEEETSIGSFVGVERDTVFTLTLGPMGSPTADEVTVEWSNGTNMEIHDDAAMDTPVPGPATYSVGSRPTCLYVKGNIAGTCLLTAA